MKKKTCTLGKNGKIRESGEKRMVGKKWGGERKRQKGKVQRKQGERQRKRMVNITVTSSSSVFLPISRGGGELPNIDTAPAGS